MKMFNNTNCDSDYVKKIKNEYNRMRDNHSIQAIYTNILNDTRNAISNIDEVLENENMLQTILYGIKKGDTSSLGTILGTTERGGNKSQYRSYLALDEKSIIEIRISAHYETKNALLNKTNNKSQYLFQVVLTDNAPQQKNGGFITNSTSIGNTKVLTKKILSNETSFKDIRNLLMSIHDYLYFPDYSYTIEIDNQAQSECTDESVSRQKSMLVSECLNRRVLKNERRFNKIYLNERELKEMVSDITRQVLAEEYKVVEKEGKFKFGDGREIDSLLTLKDETGGETRIIEDDGCYVLYQKILGTDDYDERTYIYPEAFNAMKKYLPNLPLR